MAEAKNAHEIRVPELGESILEATVSRWIKQEGDRVTAGEAVVELETDKVNLEVGAPTDGVLSRIDRRDEEDVKVGDVLGVVEAPGVVEAAEASTQAPSQPAPAAEKVDATPADSPAHQPTSPPPTSPPSDGGRATPVAARMAEEKGISLAEVKGTGPGGTVTKGDLESYLASRQKAAPKPAPEAPKPPAEAAPGTVVAAKTVLATMPDGQRPEERVKMSRRRRTIAARLVEAQQTAAILTTFNEADMTAVMGLRKRRNEAFVERYGIKLGFTSFFVKAATGALKAFPRLNAEIDGDEMVLKHYYDIGVAVGAEEGLVVPVLRNADSMSFAGIEQKIKDFATRAADGTLTLEDLRGGTFTITNGGVFGSLLSTPILTPPQVGILGLHKIEPRPVVVNNEMVIRPMMYLALSYDHRIVDGREAVQFLVRVKELIEDPESLLLEG